MNWIIENWYIVIALSVLTVTVVIAFAKFLGLPTAEQVKKIKLWLLYAVTVAETELGSGTGILKLRKVYDAFLTKFPIAARLISFEMFSLWVDDALDEMRELLKNNAAIKAVVAGEVTENE